MRKRAWTDRALSLPNWLLYTGMQAYTLSAVEDNLFCVAIAAPHDMVSLHVPTRQDGQRIARDSFCVELCLNLRLQLVARFACPTPWGGGWSGRGLWREASGRR